MFLCKAKQYRGSASTRRDEPGSRGPATGRQALARLSRQASARVHRRLAMAATTWQSMKPPRRCEVGRGGWRRRPCATSSPVRPEQPSHMVLWKATMWAHAGDGPPMWRGRMATVRSPRRRVWVAPTGGKMRAEPGRAKFGDGWCPCGDRDPKLLSLLGPPAALSAVSDLSIAQTFSAQLLQTVVLSGRHDLQVRSFWDVGGGVQVSTRRSDTPRSGTATRPR